MRIDRATLLPLVQHAAEIADKGSPNITGCARLVAGLDRLTAQATDHERSGDGWAAADGDGEWSVCVPAAQLAKLVGLLPDGATVSLLPDGDTLLRVEAGRARYTLAGMPAAEFPDLSDLDALGTEPAGVAIDSEALRRLLSLAATVSQDDGRPAICGVYLHGDGQTLRAVATDGHRLTTATIDAAVTIDAILHRGALGSLRRMLDASPMVWLSRAGRGIVFASHGRRLVCRAIEANFPDYTKAVPAANAGEPVAIDADALLADVNRVAPMAAGADAIMRLTLTASGLALDASGGNGDAHAELDADWTGKPATYGINPAFLRDACRSLGGTLTLRLRDQVSPILVTSDAAPNAVVVLMPMRL